MKLCRRCLVIKPRFAFHKCVKGALGLHFHCMPCKAQSAREWLEKNRDHVRTKAREDWLKKRDGLKEYRARKFKEWSQKNPMRATLHSSDYRAKKYRAQPAWANTFFINEAYDLARRRTQSTGLKWEVDHIVPLKHKLVCGLHTEGNLQVITRHENATKSNSRWPDMPNGTSGTRETIQWH